MMELSERTLRKIHEEIRGPREEAPLSEEEEAALMERIRGLMKVHPSRRQIIQASGVAPRLANRIIRQIQKETPADRSDLKLKVRDMLRFTDDIAEIQRETGAERRMIRRLIKQKERIESNLSGVSVIQGSPYGKTWPGRRVDDGKKK